MRFFAENAGEEFPKGERAACPVSAAFVSVSAGDASKMAGPKCSASLDGPTSALAHGACPMAMLKGRASFPRGFLIRVPEVDAEDDPMYAAH